MVDKEKILAGRNAVDAMLGAFKGLGFNSIQEFFDASKTVATGDLDVTVV